MSQTKPVEVSHKRVLSGLLWGQIARIGDIGLNFLFAVLIIRLMTTATYGTYSTILNFTNLSTTLLSFGLSETLMRYLPKLQLAEQPYYWLLLRNFLLIRLGTSTVVGLVLFFLTPVLANWANNPTVSQFGWLILLLVVSFNLSDLLNSYAIANLKLKLTFVVRSLTQLTGIIVTLLWFWLVEPGPLMPLLVLFFTQLSQIILYLRSFPLSQIWKPVTVAKNTLRPIYNYAFSIWIINIFTYALAGQFDILVLTFVLKNPEQIAYYTLVVLIWSRVQTLISGWGTSSITVLGTVEVEKGKAGLARYFNYYYKLSLLTILPVFIWICTLAPSLIPLVFTTRYQPAIIILCVFGLSTIISTCLGASNVTSFVLVLNRQNRVLPWRFVFSLTNAILDLVLIPQLGAMGAVIATSVSTVTLHLVELLIIRDVIQSFPWAFLLKLIIALGFAGIPCFICVVSIQSYIIGMLVGSLMFVLILPAALLVLKPIDQSDLSLAQNVRPAIASVLRRFTHS